MASDPIDCGKEEAAVGLPTGQCIERSKVGGDKNGADPSLMRRSVVGAERFSKKLSGFQHPPSLLRFGLLNLTISTKQPV